MRLQNTLAALQARVAGPISAAWITYNKTVADAQVQTQRIIKLGGDAGAANAQLAAITKAAAAARDYAIKQEMDHLKIDFLNATGQTAAAATLQITDQWQKMLDDLTARSDTAGVAMVKKLISVETAQAQIQQLQQQFQNADSTYSLQAQAINSDQSNGLTSQIEARQKLLDLNQQYAAQLQQMLPLLQQQAAISGRPEDLQQVAAVEEKIRELQSVTSAWGEALRTQVTSSFDSLFDELLSRTVSVKQAFADFFKSVAEGLAKMALEALAQKAIGGLLTKLNGGDSSSDVSGGAGKLTTASGTLLISSLFLGSNADKLQHAADTLLAANVAGFAAGFATGGFTGPGGVNEPAGIVHKGEGVLNQGEIAALGGPSGFYALRHAIRNGFADGGLVDAPSPAQLGFAQPPRLNVAGLRASNDGAPRPVNIKTVIVMDKQQMVEEIMNTPAGHKVIVQTVGNNPRTIQAKWSS